MSFLTYDGLLATNPNTPSIKHLLLSSPASTDVLILAEFDSSPYDRVRDGFDKSAGRSLTGGIKVQGNNYNAKWLWRCQFLVNKEQLDLFEIFLANQISDQITLEDRWRNPIVTPLVWIDVDDRYASERGTDWLLQFTAKEES